MDSDIDNLGGDVSTKNIIPNKDLIKYEHEFRRLESIIESLRFDLSLSNTNKERILRFFSFFLIILFLLFIYFLVFYHVPQPSDR